MAPPTSVPIGPPWDVVAAYVAHRLDARTIAVAGDCDGRLVEAFGRHGVEFHRIGAEEHFGPAAASTFGPFDLVLCTHALDRMTSDRASSVVARVTSIARRVVLAAWWEDRTTITAASLRHALTLFARQGFSPVADGDGLALLAIRLDRIGEAGDRDVGDFIAERLVREQAFGSLAQDRRSRLAHIAAVEREKKDLSARLQASEAALRSRNEANQSKWFESIPFGGRLLWLRLTNRIAAVRDRRRRLADDIRATGLFDETYYRVNNPYVTRIAMDPALHFALIGWKMDRRPNPYFAPLYYTRQVDDRSRAGENPLLHFARSGWRRGMRPSPEFDPVTYLESKLDLADPDVNPLLHYIEEGYPPDPSVSPDGTMAASPEAARSVPEVLEEARASCAPLRVYLDEQAEPTVTIVLDKVARGFASDHSGTAVVVGCLLAGRLQAKLRIATRQMSLAPSTFGEILHAHGVDDPGSVDFAHIPAASRRSLPITRRDRMLTTSWTATRAALGALASEQVLYLMQEDERAACLRSDDRLLFDETMSTPGLGILVATRELFDRLAASDASKHLEADAHAFEPITPRLRANDEKRERKNFVFYADATDRSCFYQRGLESIYLAMCEGVLPAQQWTIHFIGRRLESVVLPDGILPILHENPDWDTYSKLIPTMDLGLCLVEEPCRCRVALDLASAGAVVVTNASAPEASSLSPNILPTRLDVASVCQTLRQGATLATDLTTRSMNRGADPPRRTWDSALAPVFDKLRIGTV